MTAFMGADRIGSMARHDDSNRVYPSALATPSAEPGSNRLSPSGAEDWKLDFRVPDVALFLADTRACNRGSHWEGPADLLVEITSPGDRTREKIGFYESIGVVELLAVDREGWAVELHRREGPSLALAGRSTLEHPVVLRSERLGLEFRLVPGEDRPHIRVTQPETGRAWEA